MVKTVKLDKCENYLIDTATNELLDRYDPNNRNLQLVIKLDNSELIVEADKINIEYGNLITVKFGDTKYIIDDGYQNMLVKSGYIVYKDYDEKNIMDRNEGLATRDFVMTSVRDTIDDMLRDYNINNDDITRYEYPVANEFCMGDKFYQYYIVLDTVNSIVNKNQLRKDNSLAFYPFDKRMDKFGTIYVSIFVERVAEDLSEMQENKFTRCDNIIKDLISRLGPNYHFITQQIKRRVVKAKGL